MSTEAQKKRGKLLFWFVVVFLLVLVGAYFLIPSFALMIHNATSILLTGDIKRMRIYIKGFGIWAPVVSMGLMVFQALAAPLPAFVITFANAAIFGWKWGAFYSWTGAMIGAAICWAIGKVFGRAAVEKFTGRAALVKTDKFFAEHGANAVMVARLIPVIPFDIVSYAAGLTSMTFWSFFIATGVGQFPATILYSYVGDNITRNGVYFLWGVAGFALLLSISWYLKKRVKAKEAEQPVV